MLPFFAVLTPVVILFCGLAVDLSMLQLRKIQLQSAVDAAVIGAEIEYERTGNYPGWLNQAKADAAANGFTNGSNGVTVTAVYPPNYGNYSGFYDTLQITISQVVKTPFMAAANGGTVTLSAKASAVMPPCLYASGGVVFGTFPVFLQSVGVNGNCPGYVSPNIYVDGFAHLNLQGTNVTGPPGSVTGGGSVYGARYNVATMTDPLAYIPQPVFNGHCDYTGYYALANIVNLVYTTTLSPGKYCGGINLTNSTVSLQPGLYIITGSSTWLNSNVSLATPGAGVTLFFTAGGGSTYGGLTINNGTIALSAPVDASSGGIPTILIFGDRNRPALVVRDYNCYANSFTGDGIWYTTNTGITMQCPISAPHYLVFDTNNFSDFANGFSFSENFSNIPTGNPFRPLGGLVQ